VFLNRALKHFPLSVVATLDRLLNAIFLNRGRIRRYPRHID